MKIIRPPSVSTGAAARVMATVPMTLTLRLVIEIECVEAGSSTVLPWTVIAALLIQDVEPAEVRSHLCDQRLGAVRSAWLLRIATARTPLAFQFSRPRHLLSQRTQRR